MQSGYNSWNLLAQLQRQLKKEFLLVEKEQQEKVKLKRQIEQLVRSYHQLCIEMHHPGAELLKDEGFDNSYNFIKEVVTGISNNLELGRAIIYHAHEQTTLPSLLIHGLYENLQTNDAFNKDITRLIYNLSCDLLNAGRTKREKERVVESWKLYMQKIEHCNYFEQIANPTILQLLQEDKYSNQTLKPEENQKIDQNKLRKKFRLQNIEKQKLLHAFIEKVQAESLMCLPSIKIPLRGLIGTPPQPNKSTFRKIWALVSYFYLQPFVKIVAKNQVPQSVRQNILQFVDELVVQWGFTGELALQSLELKDISGEFVQTKLPRIVKIASKLVQVNEERMKCFQADLSQATGEIQIRINGGCLSLVQLRDLLILLHSHKEVFSKINEKVINRTNKIFQISQNLQVLNRDRPAMQFTSLAELKYEESISSDYYRNYTVVYRGETLKQMLKQVLVQTQNIWDLRSQHRNSLAEIFEGLVTQNRQYHTGAAISAQLQMKIRYLIYLLEKKLSGDQKQILIDLKQDLRDRDAINIRLFEDTKFSLLKVYCNLRSLKNQLKNQKEAEKKRINKITLIHKLEALRMDFCITSKASRNVGQGEQQDTVDRYKYRLSLADQILMQPINQCIHKDNVFTGRHSHGNNVSKLITIFANLQEVKYFIAYPSFICSRQSSSRYLHCDEGKIGQALHQFLRNVTQKIKTEQEDRAVIQYVVLRYLNELILGTSSSPIVSHSDRLLLQKIDMVSQNKNQQLESPRKKLYRRRGSHQFIEGPMQEDSLWGSNELQLYQMGKRYLNLLTQANTSNEKIRKLRQMVDIYKIALGKKEGESNQSSFLQDLIQKSIMVARPVNFISQLSFIEMFLAEEKLISGDGKVLKQFQKAAQKIIKTEVTSSCKKEMRQV